MLIASALAALLLLAVLGLFAGGSVLRHRAIYAGCALAALALILGGLKHLGASPGTGPAVVLPLGLPWIAAHARLDNLSALFMMVVNLGTLAASVYGIGYCRHLDANRRITPVYPLFLFGMNAVLLADDAFVFLVSWEFMSLASWLLVLAEHRRAEARAAAQVYLVMAAFGTFCLLTSFGLLAGPQGAYTFGQMRGAELSSLSGFLVVLFALLGAGSKAGLVPLHAWLPLAHPAAPSHVSALMSGVMTKVAIYGLVRILFDLVHAVPWEWGAAMMVAGGATAVLGVLYALMQDDLKRLLAYSTVENIGVVVIGLGLAIAFKGAGEPALAALALVAGLYHVVNHAVFKTLMFLGAGAVLAATHERRLSGLGGLLGRMPWTGVAMLVGAGAMASLPPLNGFVSEWMIFQALFKGPSLPHWAMKFGVPVVGAALALAAALAAGCFVRAYGIVFLGRPRTLAAAQAAANPTPASMRFAMAALALLCLLLGAVPVTITDALSGVVQPLTGVHVPVSADLGWPWLSPVSSTRGSYSGTVLMMLGAFLFAVVVVLAHGLGTTRIRRADAWDCGFPEAIPETQYGSHSFSQPQRRVFGSSVFFARETVEMPAPGDTAPARFRVRMIDPVWDGLYRGLIVGVGLIADLVNRLQFLTVRRYLLMMFGALVFMLLIVAWRQHR